MCGLSLTVRFGAAMKHARWLVQVLIQRVAPQGKDAVRFLETLVVGDVSGLADGTGSLSVITNESGGVIDDTVITKARCRSWPPFEPLTQLACR
jgi:hypothetical protein